MSKVGGISSLVNTFILIIVKYLVYKSWESDIFKSMHGEILKINKSNWEELTSKISFSNLFKLFDKVENLKEKNKTLKF